MRVALATILLLSGCVVASAHHPLWPTPPIGYRFEPIPPLGSNLPWSYRARYNRPTYFGGKIAYHIAPSSQEAMSWHENVHRGAYRNHAGRIEPIYIVPKPWEVFTVEPRTPAELARTKASSDGAEPLQPVPLEYGDVEDSPVVVGR